MRRENSLKERMKGIFFFFFLFLLLLFFLLNVSETREKLDCKLAVRITRGVSSTGKTGAAETEMEVWEKGGGEEPLGE